MIRNGSPNGANPDGFVKVLTKDMEALTEMAREVENMSHGTPYAFMKVIERMMTTLNEFHMEIDPDPRAQIRRAGGYEQWKGLQD
tara:strand:- start:563 stop:817 length:255 start_codon:yes stop_codon:yes gene_type:complete